MESQEYDIGEKHDQEMPPLPSEFDTLREIIDVLEPKQGIPETSEPENPVPEASQREQLEQLFGLPRLREIHEALKKAVDRDRYVTDYDKRVVEGRDIYDYDLVDSLIPPSAGYVTTLTPLGERFGIQKEPDPEVKIDQTDKPFYYLEFNQGSQGAVGESVMISAHDGEGYLGAELRLHPSGAYELSTSCQRTVDRETTGLGPLVQRSFSSNPNGQFSRGEKGLTEPTTPNS